MPEIKPWLENKKWVKNQIRSSANLASMMVWGFTLFWNLFSWAAISSSGLSWKMIKTDPVIGAIFLFPIVGLGLFISAVRSTIQWRRFGPTPLRLDPFPGAIGGHVGGSINTKIPFKTSHQCTVALSCVHSYMSGSGKSRSRHEKVKWQSDGVCHFESSAKGTRFKFRFNVPNDLLESDVNRGSSYHLWRVTLNLDLKGANFSRSFEIPVFGTGEYSKDIGLGTEDYHGTVEHASAGIESIADIRSVSGGVEAYFSAFQRPRQGIFMCLVGAIFAGAGVSFSLDGGDLLFPVVFSCIGGGVFLVGLNYLGKSLLVSVTRSEIKTRRFIFGLPLTTNRMQANEFKSFDIEQSGSMRSSDKQTVFYRLYATNREYKQFLVAERLASRAEVEVMKDCFEVYLPST